MTIKKVNIGIYLVLFLMLIVLFRLFQLQILEGDKYKRMSEDNRLRVIKMPAPRGVIYDRNGIPLVKNIPFYSVSLIFDKKNYPDVYALSKLLNMDVKEIEQKLSRHNSPFIPVKLKQGLSFVEIARIESRISDFPGVFIDTDVSREYLYGKLAAHVIGYLGKINPLQLRDPDLRQMPPDAFTGQWGVERIFDRELRGVAGERIIEVDALGRELKKLQEISAIMGKDIKLSIDINVQKAAEEAFADKRGSLVALKPTTGEILAMVSLPSFDPNVFSKGIDMSQWVKIMEDKRKPMLNRAIQSQYPPGSIFKIVTAVAALEEGIIDPNSKINCSGGLNYGKWTFGCWKKGGHGSVDMHKAIVESCDVYFYELGKRLGIDKIHHYSKLFGLGTETGIDMTPLKEKKGLIPNAEWKKEKIKLPWYLGDTFISSIGQGFISVTPIQAAVLVATFANGGYLYKPTFMIGGYEPVGRIDLKTQTIEIVKNALYGVVNEPNGTAQSSKSTIVKIAGKTGTAQVVGKGKKVSGEQYIDHAWFVAYAPLENPEIAISVLVEHGGGGGAVAAPIAKKTIEAYFISKNSKEN
ncbi:MAG: penicillin-binding protein 2 [Thermodesulfovibrionales bacterium]|nr:penicillin-binding protein 2 [Thermodesulfovibrionales bacterium]